MIVLFFFLNLVISFLNAWGVGKTWPETKAAGGWGHFMNWMAAIMSAVGFTWCYTVLFGGIAGPLLHKLPEAYLEKLYSLAYVVIILPLIGSGIAITINSWAHFWRERSFANGAIAGYNTFADIYNLYGAVEALPSVWDNVKDLLFGDDDDNGPWARIAIVLALLAVLSGILTTYLIVRTTAKSAALNRYFKYANS